MTNDEAPAPYGLPPRRSRLRRYGGGAALGIAVLAAGVVWNSARGVAVATPHPTGTAARQCAALQRALPQTLLGHARRTTRPASPDTAAWGDPAVTLRCGVASPPVLTPDSKVYDPTVKAMDINGVCWVADPRPPSGMSVYTTVKQQAYVELAVPAHYNGQENPLVGLTAAIAKTDPVAPGRVFDCA